MVNLIQDTNLIPSVLEELSSFDILQVDTETKKNWNDEDGFVFTLQIGTDKDQWVFDCTQVDIKVFKNLLESRTLILQNAKYDLKWFFRYGIFPTFIIDTLLAECVLTCGLKDRKLGLDALVEKYCGASLDKTIRGKINYLGLTSEVIEYARKDVVYLTEIWNKQKELLQQKYLVNVAQLEFDCVAIFAEMEFNGIRMNTDKWLEIEKDNQKKVKQLFLELDKFIENIGDRKFNRGYQLDLFQEARKVSINWNSPAQVNQVMTSVLKQPITSVDSKQLEKIQHPFVKLYLEFKDYQTKISKYGKKFLTFLRKGKIHTDYWQVLNTGRVSSGKKDVAPNMQNIPKEDIYRECFISDNSKSFICADYSAQELVLIAEDSGETVFIEALKNGYDLHSFVAEMVFKERWKAEEKDNCVYFKFKQKCSCKGHKVMRNKVKTMNYALSYGAGASKLAFSLNITIDEAKQILHDYFKAMPALKKYFEKSQQYGITNGYSITFSPFNRKRYYDKPESDNEIAEVKRQSANSRIQGTGADMIKLALVNLDKERKTLDYKVEFILQVHDEILCQTSDEYAEDWKHRMKRVMEETSKVFLKKLYVPVDIKISKKWEK